MQDVTIPYYTRTGNHQAGDIILKYVQEFYNSLETGEWLNGMAIAAITPTGPHGEPEVTYFNIGESDNQGTLVTENTIFEIGSNSKVFTCTMLAQAIENGLVDLDTYAQSYYDQEKVKVTLPVYTHPKTGEVEQMRIVDLADYTSGMTVDSPPVYIPYGFTTKDMYSLFDGMKLTYPPGSKYIYIDGNFAIIADILSKLQGRISYPYMLTKFLSDAGLKLRNTGVVMSNNPGIVGMSQGYETDGSLANYALASWPAYHGAGGIYSNAADMATWLKYNLGLTNSPLNNLLDITQQPYFIDETGVAANGLGWFLSETEYGVMANKDGGTTGFHSWNGLYRGQGYGLVLLANANFQATMDNYGKQMLNEMIGSM